MKVTILISFVAISLLSSSVTLANVIPKAIAGEATSSSLQPAVYRRIDLESLETPVNDTSPPLVDSVARAVTLLGSLSDSIPGTIKKVLPSGLSSLPPSLSSRGDDKDKDKDKNTDRQYLNFALFVAQLEFAFFQRGLERHSEQDFRRAGFANWVRGRYQQIKEHAKIHMNFLENAVTTSGVENVQPCDYNFPDNDVRSFVDLSAAITQTVTSIYVGGLHFFYNREYVTVGASILAVKARQASWINSSVRKENPWNTAFETPLSPSQGLTLLASFFDFKNMPSINEGLLPSGLRPAPPLWVGSRLIPGEYVELSFPYSDNREGERLYGAFLVGFETIIVRIEERRGDDNHKDEHKGGNGNGNGDGNGHGHDDKGNGNDKHDKRGGDNVKYYVRVPRDLAAVGNVYVLVVRGNEDINGVRIDDENTVAGPALVAFPFDSNGKPILRK